MKKKILFIGSLPTKKVHFNGETNKTGDIFKILKKANNYRLTKVNLTRFKIFNVIRMIFCSILFKYDSVFVSKCVVGGSLAIHLILKFGRKSNKKNIYYYWIGNGTAGFEGKKMYLTDLEKCRCVILESNQILEENPTLNLKSHIIIPCIKPNYDISVQMKDYKKIDILKCIYFSRICEQKGLMDAIMAIELANSKLGFKAFALDIAGAPTTDEAKIFEKSIIDYLKDKQSVFHYFGPSFHVTGLETYLRLQDYDLHLFPSRFLQECVPGSIVDMFIAGVPTVSSLFPNAKNVLSENDSFFFEQGSVAELAERLVSIYKDKEHLNSKRIASHKLYNLYNEDHFIDMIKQIGLG